MYAYTHVHMYICTHVHMHTCTHVHMHPCTHTHPCNNPCKPMQCSVLQSELCQHDTHMAVWRSNIYRLRHAHVLCCSHIKFHNVTTCPATFAQWNLYLTFRIPDSDQHVGWPHDTFYNANITVVGMIQCALAQP